MGSWFIDCHCMSLFVCNVQRKLDSFFHFSRRLCRTHLNWFKAKNGGPQVFGRVHGFKVCYWHHPGHRPHNSGLWTPSDSCLFIALAPGGAVHIFGFRSLPRYPMSGLLVGLRKRMVRMWYGTPCLCCGPFGVLEMMLYLEITLVMRLML